MEPATLAIFYLIAAFGFGFGLGALTCSLVMERRLKRLHSKWTAARRRAENTTDEAERNRCMLASRVVLHATAVVLGTDADVGEAPPEHAQ